MKPENQTNLQPVSWSLVENLRENPTELRKHKAKKLEMIMKSIKKTRIFVPVVVDKGTIVAGNLRFRAAKALGLSQIPVINASGLSKEELRAYAIADNKFTIDAEWNLQALSIEFTDLRAINFDFELIDFEIPEVDTIIQKSKIDEAQSDEKQEDSLDETFIKEQVKPGDLWQVGKHKLFCGDALLPKSYNFLMGNDLATMVMCDPPFNVKIDGHVCGNGKIKHNEFAMASGEMSEQEFIEFIRTFIKQLIAKSKNGSLAYIFMDWRHSFEILTAGKEYTELKNICVWNKMVGGMGSLYRSQHEFVFVFKNGTEKHINNVQLGKFGRNRTNVWDHKGVRVSNAENKDDLKYHPTCKPVNMIAEAILDASNPNNIVLDCFAGSGSTLLACEKTDRICYAMELEPHYCDVIIHRWEAMSGNKAVLIANIDEMEEVSHE